MAAAAVAARPPPLPPALPPPPEPGAAAATQRACAHAAVAAAPTCTGLAARPSRPAGPAAARATHAPVRRLRLPHRRLHALRALPARLLPHLRRRHATLPHVSVLGAAVLCWASAGWPCGAGLQTRDGSSLLSGGAASSRRGLARSPRRPVRLGHTAPGLRSSACCLIRTPGFPSILDACSCRAPVTKLERIPGEAGLFISPLTLQGFRSQGDLAKHVQQLQGTLAALLAAGTGVPAALAGGVGDMQAAGWKPPPPPGPPPPGTGIPGSGGSGYGRRQQYGGQQQRQGVGAVMRPR